MNTYVETARAGSLRIFGNAPVEVRHFIGHDAPGDLMNVSWHPEMKGVIEDVTLLRGAQGLGVHGGDFRRALAIRRIRIADMTPVLRDGMFNSDCIDLAGASRVTLEDVLCERGHGGIKLGTGNSVNNIVRRATVRHMAAYGLVATMAGHAMIDCTFEDCTVGFEARPGMAIVNPVTRASRDVGMLATGGGEVVVVGGELDSVSVDSGTALRLFGTKVGRVVRCDGEIR